MNGKLFSNDFRMMIVNTYVITEKKLNIVQNC